MSGVLDVILTFPLVNKSEICHKDVKEVKEMLWMFGSVRCLTNKSEKVDRSTQRAKTNLRFVTELQIEDLSWPFV